MPPWFCLSLHARYQCRHGDARGTFVSLSHFCPTAALMLLERAVVDTQELARHVAPIEGPDPT